MLVLRFANLICILYKLFVSFCVCRSWYGCWHPLNGLPLEGWTVWHAVLATLWALSTQESYHSVANRFHGTESLICDQLVEFCFLIKSNLANEIHWPQREEAEMSALGFFSIVGLPDTLCVVGMCFIPIEKPTDLPDPEV